MRRSRRPLIPQRRRVFLGCEGESERGYGALIRQLLEHRRRDVHLDVVLLSPGGGDPLALLERAQTRIIERERRHESPYELRALLIDDDKLGQAPHRDARIAPLALTARVRIIWQRPCHEAFLLRHLDRCRDLRPPTAEQALAELLRRWPEYVKGMPAAKLAERIGHAEVQRVLTVESELAGFLAEVGYTSPAGGAS